MTITLVVDSSIIIKWLSKDKEEFTDYADKILNDAQNDRVILLAPELAKYEVGNVLLFSKKLSAKQGEIALTHFFNLPVEFITESKKLAINTYNLAYNLGMTYYDASFLSLARQYNAALLTDNIKHQGKTLDIKVIQLKDY